jgi:drug/metabolite transporter (DMT)-like permease
MAVRDGLLATLMAGVLFGTTVPLIKLGLNLKIPPDLFVELRFAIASAVVILLLGKSGWVRWTLFKSKQIWIVGIVNAAGYVTQFQGQNLVSSSNAALIISTGALMVPIIALMLVHERLGWRKIVGVSVGFIGTVLVVTRGQGFQLASSELLGDILILATAVTIAMFFVLSKTLVEKNGGRPVTGGLLIVTSLMLLPSVPFDQNLSLSFPAEAWLSILLLAIPATAGAYYLLMKGLESVSPTVSSIILPIEVIVAVALSVILFNDPFNLVSGTGAALIITGVILVSTAA